VGSNSSETPGQERTCSARPCPRHSKAHPAGWAYNRVATVRDGGWKILCNGEIFNYKDLALEFGIDKSTLRTDIDLLLQLVAKWNQEPEMWLKKLNGDFAGVAFVSGDYGILFRDPTGIRPLYRAFSADNRFIGAAS